MGDILYGEHDSIKHSIKSSLINLTLALGGGRRRDPRRGALLLYPAPHRRSPARYSPGPRGRGRHAGPSHGPYVTLGTLRWRDGPGAPRFEIAATLAREGDLPYYLWGTADDLRDITGTGMGLYPL